MRTGLGIGLLALVSVAVTALATEEEPLVKAVELPAKAEALRKGGVPDKEVGEAIGAAKGKGLSAGDSADLLDSAEKAREKNGHIENFGAFVQSKLDEGLRGRELAAAIRAEHEARGIGKGPPEGKGPDGEKGGGPPEGKGPDGEKGGKAGKSPDGEPGEGGGGQGGGKAGKGGKSK